MNDLERENQLKLDASPIPTAEEAKVILSHSTNYWEFVNALGLAR